MFSFSRSTLRRSLILAAGTLAAAAAVLVAPAAEAAFPGRNGAIVLVSSVPRIQGTLWLLNADGSASARIPAENPPYRQIGRRLVGQRPDAREVSMSPDGTRVAFWATSRSTAGAFAGPSELHIARAYPAPGQRFIRTTVIARGTSSGAGPGTRPAWSRDGRHIVFGYGGRSAEWEVRVVRSDGTGMRTIGGLPLRGSAPDPTWSPDGQRLAFVGERPGPGGLMCGAIFTARIDGTDVRPVTEVQQGRWADSCGGVSAPAWSPDGTTIAFLGPGAGHDQNVLWVVGARGGAQTKVADSPRRGVNWRSPVWSPDGRRIAVVGGGIWVMSPNGSGARRVKSGAAATAGAFSIDWQRCVPRGPCGARR